MSPGKLGCLVLHNTQHRLSDCDRLLNPWGPRLQYTWRSLAEATAATLANTSPVRISVNGAIKSIISPIISKSTLYSVVIACTCENANFSLMVPFSHRNLILSSSTGTEHWEQYLRTRPQASTLNSSWDTYLGTKRQQQPAEEDQCK